MKIIIRCLLIVSTFLLLPSFAPLSAQKGKNLDLSFKEDLYKGVKWRLVGPFRGGRSGTAVGVPGQPNLYYMGTAGGGVGVPRMGVTLGLVSPMDILVDQLVLLLFQKVTPMYFT